MAVYLSDLVDVRKTTQFAPVLLNHSDISIISDANDNCSVAYCHGLLKYQSLVAIRRDLRNIESPLPISSSRYRKTQIFIRVFGNTIYVHEGIPPHHQRLVSGCRKLGADSKLADQTMTLVGRLVGGNPEPNPRIMPVTWWLGFARSYQDGRVGGEGRIRHVLTEFQFAVEPPRDWFSHKSLAYWTGIRLFEGWGPVIAADQTPYRVTTGIASLVVVGCRLLSIPDMICYFSSLMYLYVSDNRLRVLPDSIGDLASLEILHIQDNLLTSIPESIGKLEFLNTLVASTNRLMELPESIGNMRLSSLFVSGNQLVRLPNSIGNIAALVHLVVTNNLLTALPESLTNLRSLRMLYAYGNPCTATFQGRDEIKRAFNRDGLELVLQRAK